MVRLARAQWPFLVLFAAVGISYLAEKAFWHSGSGLDFRLIWLAGKMWSAGQNPYGAEFHGLYFAAFGLGPNTHFWVYPPNWWPLAVPLSFLSFKTAFLVWRLLNVAALVAATALVARSVGNSLRQNWLPIFLAGLGYVCLMQSTAVTFALGQTSIVVYLGIALFVYGLLENRSGIIVAALVCLMMKPNIGVVAVAAIAVVPRHGWTLIPTLFVCVVLSAPAMLSGAPQEVVAAFLENLRSYPDFIATSPANETGVGISPIISWAPGLSLAFRFWPLRSFRRVFSF